MTRALLVFVLVILECDEGPLTQLVVVVDSDLPTSTIDSIAIDVRSPSAMHTASTLRVDATRSLPGSVSLVHREGPLGPLEIVAEARRGADVVVTRRVRTSFVRSETRVVIVHLLGACAGVTCEVGSSCGERGCVSPDVDPTTLGTWEGILPMPLHPTPPAMDAATDAGDRETDGATTDAHDAQVPDAGADASDLGPGDAAIEPDAGPTCALRHPPPPRPGGGTSGVQRFFAAERFDIGETAPMAWRSIGLDVDNRCTTSESPLEELECSTRVGAGHPDGEEGIDNQFGAAILRTLTVINPAIFDELNTSFARGTYGVVLSISGWNLEPNDDAVVVGLIEASSGRGPFGPPEHLGEDTWTASTDAVIAGDVERPLCSSVGYVAGGVVVVQLPSRCGFRISTEDGNVVQVRLSRPTVMMTIDPAEPGFGDGVLAGRWRVSDFVDDFPYIASDFCPDALGPVLEAALDTASDVLAEGDADPDLPCDAVSFGARFHAGPAFVDPIAGPAFVLEDRCR